NPLSTTPCLSGHTALAIDDHPGPESVRALITRSPGGAGSAGNSGEPARALATRSPSGSGSTRGSGEVRALITLSPGDTDSDGGSGTTSPGDSVRGAAFPPYGSRLVPYTPADISDVRTGGRSARSRSKRRPSMPTTSTLLLSWDIPPSKRHG